MSEEKEYPSLPEQGKNMAKFVWDLFQHTMQNSESLFVSDEVAEERIKICQKCEWYDAVQNRCKECGCHLGPKVKFGLESCPIGSWSAHDDEWINGGFEKVVEEMKKQETDI